MACVMCCLAIGASEISPLDQVDILLDNQQTHVHAENAEAVSRFDADIQIPVMR